MIRFNIVVWCVLWLTFCAGPAAAGSRRMLEYSPAPVDNPLKGLVPYQSDVRGNFPHSMEFNYLPYSSVVKGYDEFDWQPLERMLDDIASRGHQSIFRIYLEYPGKAGAIPDFLLQDGLKVTKWNQSDNPNAAVETPDYEDLNLRRSLKHFISALGARYDGDPRIGFITAGLLGIWGEWHNHPREDLFASKAVQREVMDAYEAAFRTTRVLLRYPAGDQNHRLAKNADRQFGYHDDSFAWATLDTGKRENSWFFVTALNAAGPNAEHKWKTQPIGGEIRPEAWGHVFEEIRADQRIQDFGKCVEATHASWLMDSGMFRKKQGFDRMERAERQVRLMGYEFHALAVTIGEVKENRLIVSLEIENRGVAPFYYDWKPEYGLLAAGQPVKTLAGSGSLKGLLPDDEPRIWTDLLDLGGIEPGTYALAVRVPNPLKGGKPMRFANVSQDSTHGWLSLGDVWIP